MARQQGREGQESSPAAAPVNIDSMQQPQHRRAIQAKAIFS